MIMARIFDCKWALALLAMLTLTGAARVAGGFEIDPDSKWIK